jgi:hypothetical protein
MTAMNATINGFLIDFSVMMTVFVTAPNLSFWGFLIRTYLTVEARSASKFDPIFR